VNWDTNRSQIAGLSIVMDPNPTLEFYKSLGSVVVEILNVQHSMQLMQKNYLISEQIGMPLTMALKSIGYTEIVLFLTFGKSDI
jgi:hypothetical protein